MRYFKHPITGEFRPDMRSHTERSVPNEKRKTEAPLHFTTDQYDFLKDCLLRREERHAGLRRSEQRCRHGLVAISLVFMMLLFAATDFKVHVSLGFATFDIPLELLLALVPFLVSYMILNAIRTAGAKERLRHECRVIELELRKFGFDTSYSLLDKYKEACHREPNAWENMAGKRLRKVISSCEGAFVTLLVVLTFAGSTWVAIERLFKQTSEPVLGIILGSALILGIAMAALAALCRLWMKSMKEKVLDEYVKSLRHPIADASPVEHPHEPASTVTKL